MKLHITSLLSTKKRENGHSSPHCSLPCLIRTACTALTHALGGQHLTHTLRMDSSIYQSRLSKHTPSSPLKIQIQIHVTTECISNIFCYYRRGTDVCASVSSYDWGKKRTNPILTLALDESPAPEVMWD